MDVLDRIGNRLISKDKQKAVAWELWGKPFTLWILDIYEDRYREDKPFSKKRLTVVYRIVGETYKLWESNLEDMGLGDKGLSIRDMFLDLSEAIEHLELINISKDGRITLKKSQVSYPFDFVTLTGILKWHLTYFLGHTDVWKYLPTILSKSKHALIKLLQRSQYKKINLLKEYRSEVSIFTSQIICDYLFQKRDEEKSEDLAREMDRFYAWCEEKEARVLLTASSAFP